MARDLRIERVVDCPRQMSIVNLNNCDKCPHKGARSKYLQTCKWEGFEGDKT